MSCSASSSGAPDSIAVETSWAAAEPLLAAPDVLVQPGVLDRDGGGRGERDHDVLVLGGEPARLVGQVEVADDGVADSDRDAEEAAHLGW